MTTAAEYMTKTAQEVLLKKQLREYNKQLQNLSEKLTASLVKDKLAVLREVSQLLEHPPEELGFADNLATTNDFSVLRSRVKNSVDNLVISDNDIENIEKAIKWVDIIGKKKEKEFNALSKSNFSWEGPTVDFKNRMEYIWLAERHLPERKEHALKTLRDKWAESGANKEDIQKKIEKINTPLSENEERVFDQLHHEYGDKIEFFNLVHNEELAEGLRKGIPLPQDKTLLLNCYNMVYLSAYLAEEMNYQNFREIYTKTDPRIPGDNMVSIQFFARDKHSSRVMSDMFSAQGLQTKADTPSKQRELSKRLMANEVISWDGTAHIAIALGDGKVASFWVDSSVVGGPYKGQELAIADFEDLKVSRPEVIQTASPTWRPETKLKLALDEFEQRLLKAESALVKAKETMDEAIMHRQLRGKVIDPDTKIELAIAEEELKLVTKEYKELMSRFNCVQISHILIIKKYQIDNHQEKLSEQYKKVVDARSDVDDCQRVVTMSYRNLTFLKYKEQTVAQDDFIDKATNEYMQTSVDLTDAQKNLTKYTKEAQNSMQELKNMHRQLKHLEKVQTESQKLDTPQKNLRGSRIETFSPSSNSSSFYSAMQRLSPIKEGKTIDDSNTSSRAP